MSNQYLVLLLGSAVLSAYLVKSLVKWATAKQLFMPSVRDRDTHNTPVPRVGGIAIVSTFVIVTLLVILLAPELLSFTILRTFGIDRNLLGVLLGVLLLSAVNIFDDLKGVKWPIKLTTQVVAALLIFWCGIHIAWLTNPFGDNYILEGFTWLFIVVWLVGLSNVVNMLDGVDGLAGSVSAVSLLTLFFLSVRPDVAQSSNALLSAIALGAVVGFLPFNVFKAKAFLGDTGSVFLGFIIGVLAIISGGKVATAFLVLSIPFIDALTVVLTRIFSGKSPFMADRLHLHHRLLNLGLKPYQITFLLSSISLIFGLIALNTQSFGKLQAALAALVMVVVFLLLYAWMERTRATKNDILKTDE